MIKNNGEGILEIRNFPNGKGEILLLHRFSQEEMFDKCSFCAEIFFAPGQSMGYHKHEKDMEIVYVLSGEIVYSQDDGSERTIYPGSMAIVGAGQGHGMRNDSNKDAKVLSIVFD